MSNQYGNQEKREVSNFSSLLFRGMGRVELRQGDHEELVIFAQPEICSRIKTVVQDGVLSIDYQENWKDWTGIRSLSGDKIVFSITMKEIKSLSLTSVGSLDTPKIESPNLSLMISGPGLITVGELNTASLAVNLSGVGVIDLAGKAEKMSANMSGAGSLKAGRLEAGNVSIQLGGVGTATVWAQKTMNASISGAGVIEYYGNPEITQNNQGLGVLKPLGNR